MPRSRAGKALIASGFAYAQFASAIVIGILLVPLMLDRLGARTYGLWLATGELLAYVALLDIGIFSVLPWMIAEADGRQDTTALRAFVVNGLSVGGAVSCVYLAGAATWLWLADAVGMSASDRALLFGPLMLVVVVTGLTYPLNLFTAVLTGLQDFTFSGTIAVVQGVLRAGLIAGLLLGGAGLYALAMGAAVPAVVGLVASALRVRRIAPELFTDWERPTWGGVRSLLREGLGGWLGGFGWKLSAASQALVITYVGTPAMVPVFACTAKLTQLFTQLSWVLPDSGLIGLAQIHGEGRAERVREVAGGILRLLLTLSGGVALMALAVNQSFVSVWVGDAFFGGVTLNMLLAAAAVVTSLVHGLYVVESVLGLRLQVGLAGLAGGVVQVAVAVVAGRHWGLDGIGLAMLLTALLVTLPAGLYLLRPAMALTPAWLGWAVVAPWLRRLWPLLGAAALVGLLPAPRLTWVPALAAPVLALVYLWWMRPLLQDLPFPPQVRRWLVAARLAT